MSEKSAYAAAGVDIEAGDRAVDLMKHWVEMTRRPEVLGGLGGFAGLFDASKLATMDHPVLATSTDGVGTKVAIAQAMDVHDTIGFDLVGMVVDDLVVCGAEPLFMTDYIACGRLEPERIAAIVRGIAEACTQAGCALLGGETAEHPGLMQPLEYDLAAPPPGWWNETASWEPTGFNRGTWCWPWRRTACMRTATHWPGTSSSNARTGRWTATCQSWGDPWARNC